MRVLCAYVAGQGRCLNNLGRLSKSYFAVPTSGRKVPDTIFLMSFAWRVRARIRTQQSTGIGSQHYIQLWWPADLISILISDWYICISNQLGWQPVGTVVLSKWSDPNQQHQKAWTKFSWSLDVCNTWLDSPAPSEYRELDWQLSNDR